MSPTAVEARAQRLETTEHLAIRFLMDILDTIDPEPRRVPAELARASGAGVAVDTATGLTGVIAVYEEIARTRGVTARPILA